MGVPARGCPVPWHLIRSHIKENIFLSFFRFATYEKTQMYLKKEGDFIFNS